MSLIIAKTGNRQQATGNRQQATGNRQQATGHYTYRLNNRVNYQIAQFHNSVSFPHSHGKTPDTPVWAYTGFLYCQRRKTIYPPLIHNPRSKA